MSTDAGLTGDADVPPEADSVRPSGRRRITMFMWIFATIALCLASAIAIAAAKPAIAVAAAFGLMIPIAVSVLARRRRPAADPGGAEHRRRRRLVWLIAVPVASAVICLVGGLLLLVGSGNRTGRPPAKTLSVSYHAAGRVEGDGVVVDEQIVLDARAMSGTTSAAGAGDASSTPTVALSGWQEAGLVDGYPSFARTQTLSWDHMSKLAGTATIPLTLGHLRTTSGSTSSTLLVPQNGSRVEIVVPKGAVGAAVPALTSRTDLPSGNHEEVIVFTVDPYVSEVSFDVLRSPLRNLAGHALYDASLWGFWQWAAGAAATAVGGFIVNKLVDSLWGLLTRRATSTVGRLRDSGPTA
jgi:hypothetical protein